MMRLGFFQYAVIQRNTAENLAYIANALQNCRCDLLVLPELFTCGYSFEQKLELAPFAETLDKNQTVKASQLLAQHLGGAVTGTIPEQYEGKLYNTALLVNTGGLIGFQRKIHLPDYEKKFFSPGESISTFQLSPDVRVGMMSCFDCWFPQFGAILRQNGAQIFCNSASFGGALTPTNLPIRARENQVFVISCNRIGSEMFDVEPENFRGESQIISPNGQCLVSAGGEEKLAVVEVDLDEINHPAFGSLICKDFAEEHQKYEIRLK